MDESADIYEVINSGDGSKLMGFLLSDENFANNFYEYLQAAFETGNFDTIKTILVTCPFKNPIGIDTLCKIPYLSHNEDKKLKMLKFLLAKADLVFEEEFDVMLCACTEKNFVLVEFFFNKYYSEEQTLYPLIKKLEAAVDEWQHIGVLLHDDIDYFNFPEEHEIDTFKIKLLENVSATFVKLLAKGTRESLALAVELFQVLIHKHFSQILLPYQELELPLPKIEEALKDPSFVRDLFQLIYNSINDETQVEIYVLLMFMASLCVSLYNLFEQFFDAFICQPLHKLLLPESDWDRFHLSSEPHGTFSLKKLSRAVIRNNISENASNVKEFMDRIWELDLPDTVKCYALCIPDASWMNNLQMS